MVIRSLLSNCEKECPNDRSSQRPELQVRLRLGGRLPLQSVHLQELQLLSLLQRALGASPRVPFFTPRTVH